MSTTYREYGFEDASAPHTVAYLLPIILDLSLPISPGMRVLDVGCGNGYFIGELVKRGCKGVGIDLSRQGVEIARQAFPQARFEVLPADENILKNLGEEPFDMVLSTEVVEHLYDPRSYARGCYAALRPGGRFICSTPYHGYLKNLLISLVGKWDAHANPLWDGGHIKLWSRNTLSRLLLESGFRHIQFSGVGRLPLLWKSMIVCGDRPV